MMSSTTLYRLGAAALIAGSLLILVGTVLGDILFPGHSSTPQQVLSFPWQFVILLILVGSLLFVIGLPAMYLRQYERVGVLGLIGFVLIFFDILLQGAVFSTLQVIILPLLAQKAPHLTGGNSLPLGAFLLFIGAGIMQIIGTIVLGIATMRARVFPRAVGILLITSGVAFLLTIPPLPDLLSGIIEIISFATLAIACMWAGYLLITGERPGIEKASLAVHS